MAVKKMCMKEEELANIKIRLAVSDERFLHITETSARIEAALSRLSRKQAVMAGILTGLVATIEILARVFLR